MLRAMEGGGASASLGYRACTRLGVWWLRLYTRGVDPRAAIDRTVGVELEFWEHAIVADQRSSAIPAAVSLVLGVVAGIPQDLRWRLAVLTEPLVWAAPPVHLLVRRYRHRFWIPLQAGHVFDQTNGLAEPEAY